MGLWFLCIYEIKFYSNKFVCLVTGRQDFNRVEIKKNLMVNLKKGEETIEIHHLESAKTIQVN